MQSNVNCQIRIGWLYWNGHGGGGGGGVHEVVEDYTCRYIPSRLEPTSLDHSDGKCPDDITMVPWKNRNLLVWDATCSDIYAPSHLAQSSMASGALRGPQKGQILVSGGNCLGNIRSIWPSFPDLTEGPKSQALSHKRCTTQKVTATAPTFFSGCTKGQCCLHHRNTYFTFHY